MFVRLLFAIAAPLFCAGCDFVTIISVTDELGIRLDNACILETLSDIETVHSATIVTDMAVEAIITIPDSVSVEVDEERIYVRQERTEGGYILEVGQFWYGPQRATTYHSYVEELLENVLIRVTESCNPN